MNPSANLTKNRKDLSPYLFHFTKAPLRKRSSYDKSSCFFCLEYVGLTISLTERVKPEINMATTITAICNKSKVLSNGEHPYNDSHLYRQYNIYISVVPLNRNDAFSSSAQCRIIRTILPR